VKPLFVIDLVRSSNEEEFAYSTPPRNFANTIMLIFNKALDDLNKTQDIEHKLMLEMYKPLRVEQFLRVP
jgi:dynein heavy chain